MKKLLLGILCLPFAGVSGSYYFQSSFAGASGVVEVRAGVTGVRADPTEVRAGGWPKNVTMNLADVRTGEWPMNLERDIDRRDTTYSLIFRDQQVLVATVMDTLSFPNLQQLRYFGQALTVLKKGNNGDIANFKDYSIKRADKKGQALWYILRIKFGLTDFQQPEADIMCKTINGL